MARIETCYPTCEKPDAGAFCDVRGCVFPHNGGPQCRFHKHCFDFKFSMTDGAIDISDLYDEEDPTRPLFFIATEAQLKNPDKSIYSTFSIVDEDQAFESFLNDRGLYSQRSIGRN